MRIDVIPSGRGKFQFCHAGEPLASSEFGACRVLAERGFVGSIETWHRNATYASMRIGIAAGAKLTVSESDAHGPRFAAWRPFSPDMRLPAARSTAEADLSAEG